MSESGEATAGSDYARRLETLSGARWKRLLDVQRPYRWNLRRLDLGRTLDIGCGIGRNLVNLGAGAIGVDHNADSVASCRAQGLHAFTVEEFLASEHAQPDAFDSLLVAHVVEHMDRANAIEMMRSYLPYLKAAGRVCFITPQEAGFKTDATHVRFVDFAALHDLAGALDLTPTRHYSFPFPRAVGKVFAYNEFVALAAH